MPEGKKVKYRDRGPAVIWDTTNIVTLYGTVLRIEGRREEIHLLFGSRTVQTGRHEEMVMVSDRIILSPFTAKRLFVLLRKVMAGHQPRFGMDSGELRTLLEPTN